MTDEQQALDSLLTHPGWLLFRQHVKAQWGPEGYARRLKQEVTNAIGKDQSVEAALKMVDFANNEIDQIQAWPLLRLKQIEEYVASQAAEPSVSRRGAGL
jgi:hypothetical protein